MAGTCCDTETERSVAPRHNIAVKLQSRALRQERKASELFRGDGVANWGMRLGNMTEVLSQTSPGGT
jgi:hypothetical protein